MSPQREKKDSWVLYENDQEDCGTNGILPPSADDRKWEIVWGNLIFFTTLHIGAVYDLFQIIISGLGITAAAHRLWAHKSYKARLPLRVLLAIFHTISFQLAAVDWVRDHRAHHKYSETDADSHNATRGFFFSHIGWVLVKKHPQIKAKGRTIDISDIYADPVLRFQKKYYSTILMPLACFILPTYIPTLWGESVWNASHKWGNRPYDKNISPTDIKPISMLLIGEGFHNYHHTFPWDYRSSELGASTFNLTTLFIEAMAKMGWAYDLKTLDPNIIKKRMIRSGDGTRYIHEGDNENEDKQVTMIDNPIRSD
ncbi:acyl-CoA Delta(11) desaturase-like [Aphomia sociella]